MDGKKLHTYRSDEEIESMFKRYIEKVLRNSKIDYERLQIRISKHEILSLDDPEQSALWDAVNLGDSDFSETILANSYTQIENLFTNDRLFEIVRGLPLRHKNILYMKYVEEKTDEETAKILGVSRQAVTKTRLQALRIIMEKYKKQKP